jgi:uncharacterized membrane protein YbhN (UPF0104 family)
MRSGHLHWLAARLMPFKWFQTLREDYRQLEMARGRWLPLLAVSILFQSIAIGIIYVLFQGVHANVTPAECALIGSIAGAATILPISINGIGVVEGALVGAAVALGVQYEDALVVAVLSRLLVVPLSLICGLIYLVEPRRAPLADQAA